MSDWELEMAVLRAEADLAIRHAEDGAADVAITIRASDLLRLLDACQPKYQPACPRLL